MTANFDEDNLSDIAANSKAANAMNASLEHYRVFRAALLKLDNGAGSLAEIEGCLNFFSGNQVLTIEDVLAFSALSRTFYLRALECMARGDQVSDSMQLANVAEQAMDKIMAYLAASTGMDLPQSTDIQRALN